MTDIELRDRRTLSVIAFAVVLVVVLGIIGGVYLNALTIDGGALLISAVLALATFAYVLLTFDMSRSMREEMQIQRRKVRLEKKPDVKRSLEQDLIPLYNDVMNVKNDVSGTGQRGADMVPIDDEFYRAYYRVSTRFEDPGSVPRFINVPINADPGNAYAFYQTVKEYRETYGEAVHQLERLILDELSNPPSDPDDLREYAVLALQLDDGTRGQSGWDSVKDDIIPLRKDVPGLMQELARLRDEIRSEGSALARELWEAQVDSMRVYEIDESELEPDSTGGLNDGSGVYTGEFPRQPQYASVESSSEDGNDAE